VTLTVFDEIALPAVLPLDDLRIAFGHVGAGEVQSGQRRPGGVSPNADRQRWNRMPAVTFAS